MKGFKVEKFEFSPDILDLSGGNFKAFLSERYADLTASQVKKLVNRFYGKDEILDGDHNTVSGEVADPSE